MFETYFTMNESQAIDYIKATIPTYFEGIDVLECKEIGDGNLNYVFRIYAPSTGASIIVKQSGPVARISDDFELSPDRNRIESELLTYQGTLAPGFVPQMFHYDPIMNCTIMEDLSDHVIARTGLIDGKTYPNLGNDLAYFLVKTLLHTTDIVLSPDVKKSLVKNYSNPELCDISEMLVFTEPYNNQNQRNELYAPHQAWLESTLYDNDTLKKAVAKLKYRFMNVAQSLLHGDLHTGSLFVKEGSTKVIDPEFAFYGPMGYDIGNVIANLAFAYVRAASCHEEAQADYLLETIEQTIDGFNTLFLSDWTEYATEPTAQFDGVAADYLEDVLQDTAGYAGTEMIRRIVGLAQVKDIHAVTETNARVHAERVVITCAIDYIMHADHYKTGKDFTDILVKTFKEGTHE